MRLTSNGIRSAGSIKTSVSRHDIKLEWRILIVIVVLEFITCPSPGSKEKLAINDLSVISTVFAQTPPDRLRNDSLHFHDRHRLRDARIRTNNERQLRIVRIISFWQIQPTTRLVSG